MIKICNILLSMIMGLYLFLFLAALTFAVAVDVRDMSIDEYINFVNPPALHKYKDKFGDSILCVKFTDQISVKYAHDDITRELEKPPKINISNFNIGGENVSEVSLKSECPEDTVAIREIKREVVERAGSVSQFLNGGRRRNDTIPNNNPTNPADGNWNEYAFVQFESVHDPVTVISVYLNVWNPYVAPDGHFSVSQIWAMNNDHDGSTLNGQMIEVGWTVNPGRYGDSQPRFFIYWTNDTYKHGCYDLDCPGFVLIPGHGSPGALLQPVSTYGGTQYGILVSLANGVLHSETEKKVVWILLIQNQTIGYWPASLFSALGKGAVMVNIGGSVGYSPARPGTRFTKTQMGSGRSPDRGYGHAAYSQIKNMYASSGAKIYIPKTTISTRPKCYKATYNQDQRTVFFGGVGGFNPNCIV